MSAARHYPTRQSVILSYTDQQIRATGQSWEEFSERLTENYLRLVPEASRSLSFRELANDLSVLEYRQRKSGNAKLVERYHREQVNFPAELEEAWVATLQEPFRRACVFALCLRYGVLPISIPECAAISSIAKVMNEDADAMQASSPIVADNRIDEADRPYAAKAYQEHMEAAAAHLGWARQLKEQFPDECASVVALKETA